MRASHDDDDANALSLSLFLFSLSLSFSTSKVGWGKMARTRRRDSVQFKKRREGFPWTFNNDFPDLPLLCLSVRLTPQPGRGQKQMKEEEITLQKSRDLRGTRKRFSSLAILFAKLLH